MTDYSKLSDEEIQTELEKGYKDIKEDRCAYVDEAFDNIRRRCKVKTKEEEQAMMRELAEFIFAFGEKYGVLLDVKIKLRKLKRGGTNDGVE